MENMIISLVNQLGYFGIFLLIAVENIFPPIPSEVILTFGGFLTTYTDLQVWGVVVAATLGSVAGALVLYAVGCFLSPEKLSSWLDGRLGRILHLKRSDVEKAQGWFDRRGKLTVFLCRFVPIVRSLISIPAGMARMHVGVFLVLTTVGTALWNVVLVSLGALFGASWEKIAGYFDTYSTVALLVIVVAVVVGGIVFYKKRVSRKATAKSDEVPPEQE